MCIRDSSKTARPHNFLDFLRCRVCQRIDIRILCVEILHHNIDPRIGALCGQADTDEQLPRLVIVKRTVGVRIFLFQTFNDGKRQFFFCHRVKLPFSKIDVYKRQEQGKHRSLQQTVQ